MDFWSLTWKNSYLEISKHAMGTIKMSCKVCDCYIKSGGTAMVIETPN